MRELALVMSPGQNAFFFELAAALQFEVERLGVRASLSTTGFPPAERGRVYVLLPPHEYFVLEDQRTPVDERLLERTVFVSAEQPGTPHFEDNVRLSKFGGALFDINAGAVREYALRGVEVQHLQLGYSPSLDHFTDDDDRKYDALFMGCFTPRRARVLAGCAPFLSSVRCRLIISDNSRPNSTRTVNFVPGEEKFELLRDSATLLNIHQSDEPYFEWARVLDAIHSGCVVVSEQSSDFGPLVAGEHFASCRPEVLGVLLEEVLADADLRRRLRRNAYEFIRSELPLAASAQRLIDAASLLDRATRIPSSRKNKGGRAALAERGQPRHDGDTHRGRATEDGLDLDELAGIPRAPEGFSTAIVPSTAYPEADPESAAIRRVLKEVRLDLIDVRRMATRAILTGAENRQIPDIRIAYSTPTFEARSAVRTSIITALYNHGTEITEALDSLVTLDDVDFEIIVVDDGSTDGSADAVVRWGRGHPEIRLLLLAHPINRGLPTARNSALDFAQGEYCFVLDADNAVYRNSLGDLIAALESDPDASFSYGILSSYKGGEPYGLVSVFPWEPLRLRHGNYIDAMALFRTDALRSMNGYSTDRRLYGWEDYDLFCRFAEASCRGVFVDKIVASYRVSDTSMLALSNISVSAAFAALKERCPRLMSAVTPPP
jgi:Glycosyl transferase family 2